jgi:hypothetical protein
MDLQKIEQLLDDYFEGETGVEDEKLLKAYFSGNDIAPHLELYRDMFAYFAQAKTESTQAKIKTLQPEKQGVFKNMKQWYSIAAFLVIALGVTFYFQNNSNTITEAERLEAEYAFEKTKEALNFFSLHFNSGVSNLSVLNEFTEPTNKIFK